MLWRETWETSSATTLHRSLDWLQYLLTLPLSLQEEFECFFGGIERLRNKIVKLHVDPDITPRQQPHRSIPFHVRGDVEKELERLDRLDVIERVEGPTPWISPIVVGPKKSVEVRICVDMGEAKKAVKRENHLMPTIDDLIADLNGATHLSTRDLSSGYHQLELAPESRFVTTLSTHVGLKCYKRLPFGIYAASEIFQESIKELLTGLPGCKNISDDIIVFGKGKMSMTRTFVVFSSDLKTTTVASTRTNASSLRVKLGSMAILLVPVVSRPTLRKLKRYAMQAHRRTPVISSPSYTWHSTYPVSFPIMPQSQPHCAFSRDKTCPGSGSRNNRQANYPSRCGDAGSY